MKEKPICWKQWSGLILITALLLSLTMPLWGSDTKPATLPEKKAPLTGVTVQSNDKASIDASNLAEGYIMAAYTGGKPVRIKVQIAKAGGATYTYDLNNSGRTEVFPLTEGDGSYTVTVFENVTGTKYAGAFSCKLDVKLRNSFLPFLYPNQYVDYTAESQAVKKAAELLQGQTDDLEKVKLVYTYVCENLTYDYELAKNAPTGYLPDIDAVLAKGSGICFDYSAVMSAMLRSQNIPCKLVVGYAGTAYHAWINVYIDGIGWVDKLIYFDGASWQLMDPTFASAYGENSDKLKDVIGDGTNYTQKYAY